MTPPHSVSVFHAPSSMKAGGSEEAAGEIHEGDVLIGVVGGVGAAAEKHLPFGGVANRGIQGGQTVDVPNVERVAR